LQVRYVVIGAIVHADISYYVCFSAGKRFFLILGLALLVASVSMIIVCLFVIKPDIVFADSVQMTTTGDYGSPIFHAEKGDWSNLPSRLQIVVFLGSHATIVPLYGWLATTTNKLTSMEPFTIRAFKSTLRPTIT